MSPLGLPTFPLDALLPGVSFKLLTAGDADDLQLLFEQCNDYALLESGQPHSPTAARDEFNTVPNGKTTRDKFLLAVLDSTGVIVGLIECIRGYPNDQTWWLGLMMLAPSYRSQGLGSAFYRAFERWVSSQGARHVALAVLQENECALRFWQKQGFQETRRTPPRRYGIKSHVLFVLRRTLDVSPQ